MTLDRKVLLGVFDCHVDCSLQAAAAKEQECGDEAALVVVMLMKDVAMLMLMMHVVVVALVATWKLWLVAMVLAAAQKTFSK